MWILYNEIFLSWKALRYISENTFQLQSFGGFLAVVC